MDNVSCCNCCNSRLIEKIVLTPIPHPHPYQLVWINQDGGIIVKNQVSVPIAIGKYKENVMCDIVPMEIHHIILGRP